MGKDRQTKVVWRAWGGGNKQEDATHLLESESLLPGWKETDGCSVVSLWDKLPPTRVDRW